VVLFLVGKVISIERDSCKSPTKLRLQDRQEEQCTMQKDCTNNVTDFVNS
jgi:hypothetical protein